ncbi:MFS transporter [Nocardioides jejuensis]|uniref:MFS transporter n=1 Tax=Nocardioides jejuensis TaxID=2502782 RepID=A0A4V2NZY9_9ACTN|nr:MFS transporter [Nocardioides jejuensis]TCJ30882.1 MFS transporter [Nocardioides jejuensis]
MTARRRPSALLALAAAAVAFAAADTYVVVLALPDMMATHQIPVTELQRAAPIISGFLLGYVAMLPLIGRLADLRGRLPVLILCLGIFAVGSFMTAFSGDFGSMVAGRFVQGVGGGGLVPATLALVADLYPPSRRAVPLGVVSAVQEVGSVLGPLFGAVVLALWFWQAIFLINVVVAVTLLALLKLAETRVLTRRDPGFDAPSRGFWRVDWLGLAALGLAGASYVLLVLRPSSVQRDLFWGQLFIPYAGDSSWTTPLGLTVVGALIALLLRCWFARRPLVDVQAWVGALRQADVVGALLLATVLGGIVLAFATAEPAVQLFAPQGHWYLLGAGVALVALAVHLRRSQRPLVDPRSLRERPAWGALVVSFLVGAALIAALVDIPIFARTTRYPESQLMAALVLVRFLAALPLGAWLGGVATRRFGAAWVAATGLVASACGFALMARWDDSTLTGIAAPTAALVLAGLGFGLALAPVTASLLAHTPADTHGVSAALAVVARMVGMLVGLSALTAIGLHRFHLAVEAGRSAAEAALVQEQTVFTGAAVCCVAAAVTALLVLRDRQRA